jgi:predicted transcriptional regulator
MSDLEIIMRAIEFAKQEFQRQNITLTDLAKKSNVSEKTIYRMFHNYDVKYSSVEKVLAALGITIEFSATPKQMTTSHMKTAGTSRLKKIKNNQFLAKINYNIAQKITMAKFEETIKMAEPSWVIDKLFHEFDLTRLSELVRNSNIGYSDLEKAYGASTYKNSKFDRYFAMTKASNHV